MAPHVTAKLEQDVSMPRCRQFYAFFGKRCVADQTEDTPSPMPSQKQQRRRAICNKDEASAAFAPQRRIQKLLSDPMTNDDPSVRSLAYAVPLTQNGEKETEKCDSPRQDSDSQLGKAEEYKPGCLKDQEEGKLINVVQRRSSRIKKLIKYGKVGINVSSMSTGFCAEEQDDPELVVPNSVQKIQEIDSTLIQSDFFLPASKRSKKQKVAHATHTLVSNGEKRQKDIKIGQLQRGNSLTNHEDFFVPASKRQNQMLNAPDPAMKEEEEDKPSNFHFDLWTEARLAAEENAQLCVGKPTHPFFAQYRGGQQASLSLGISAHACSSHQAACPEEVGLDPSPPLHITQSSELAEADLGTTAMGSWTFSGFLGNLKVDQASFRKECLDVSSKVLDGLLRVPTVDKLSVVIRRNHASRGTSLDDVLVPLLSFLKDSESVSKDQSMTAEEDLNFSSAYLKQRLNLLLLERAKRCSHDSSIMMDSCAEEGSTSKNPLWTDVYQPQSPNEVCGNRESVNRLSAWLERWRAAGSMAGDCAEGDSFQRKNSNNEDSDEDGGCFQEDSSSERGETREDAALQNVLFLAGPVGCGKTAAIYACARVQGYTVLEVSCSDNRNGLLIKQKFSESMESHRVGKWSADTNGPGNVCCTTACAATSTETTSSHGVEAIKIRRVSMEKRQKRRKTHKSKDNDIAQTSKVMNRAAQTTDAEAKQHDESVECDKSVTVLLFEDVDMVFEDDRGFMAAVAQVAASAKRPIILTSNDNRLCLPQSLGAELLEFKRPSTKELVVFAYLVCMAEGLPCRPEFLLQMVKLCKHDLRMLLNYLQFWAQGHANETSSEITDQENEAMIEEGTSVRLCLRSEEAESAFVTRLFQLEAQHRLWPSFATLSFPCQVTQLVACELNDKVSQVEKNFRTDEAKKLEDHMVEKLALLKKLKRQKVDSPLEVAGELSDNLETPVKNLAEDKAVAQSPILRDKSKKGVAATMLGSTDEAECTECKHQVVLQTISKQDSPGSENYLAPLNVHLSATCDLNGTIHVIAASPIKNGKPADDAYMMPVTECKTCREDYTSAADLEVEVTPPGDLTAESSPSLFSSVDPPPTEIGSNPGESVSRSICEPIYALWSGFQNKMERDGLSLSSASKESYTTAVSLSKLSDNLSASDVMSCVHGPGRLFLEDHSYCWESPEDCGMLQACSTFAHKSLVMCVQECPVIPNTPEEEIRQGVSIEDMMVAVNDFCAMGKLFTHDEALSVGGLQLRSVMPSHAEQEYERHRKKSSLQHALCKDLPAKVQSSFQGTSFFEYASFLARIGHIEQDRLISGAVRRRGRGFQNYFRIHPWNLSKESINILEHFGRFGKGAMIS